MSLIKFSGLLVIAMIAGGTVAACTAPSTITAVTTAANGSAATSSPAAHKKAKPKTTLAQREALGSAKSYLAFTGFSRAGLIEQLHSDAGDGYSLADATYAANHVGANWDAQAVKSAKSYLKLTSFSRAGLIEQLHSAAGDRYTLGQATYAVNKVGLR